MICLPTRPVLPNSPWSPFLSPRVWLLPLLNTLSSAGYAIPSQPKRHNYIYSNATPDRFLKREWLLWEDSLKHQILNLALTVKIHFFFGYLPSARIIMLTWQAQSLALVMIWISEWLPIRKWFVRPNGKLYRSPAQCASRTTLWTPFPRF